MGFIEDVRKVIQDLVTPDLKAIEARIDALDARFAAVEQIAQLRQTTIETKLAAMTATMESNHLAILKALDTDKHLERLEARSTAAN
jgi:hypothetical protein